MRQLRQCLLERLQQLETEQERICEAIIEVQRRKDVLDEVTSWSVPGEERIEELPPEDDSEMRMRSPIVLDEVTSWKGDVVSFTIQPKESTVWAGDHLVLTRCQQCGPEEFRDITPGYGTKPRLGFNEMGLFIHSGIHPEKL